MRKLMQRKELRKAIKKFSHQTNFYKLGLVRRYLMKQVEEHNTLVDAIPKVACPKCGSHKISVEDEEIEQSSGYYLYCDTCEETFDDTFGFKDALEECCKTWGDGIALTLYFEKPNIKTEEWKKLCEDKIMRTLA